MTSGLFLTSN